jgi:hypothetical protein
MRQVRKSDEETQSAQATNLGEFLSILDRAEPVGMAEPATIQRLTRILQFNIFVPFREP